MVNVHKYQSYTDKMINLLTYLFVVTFFGEIIKIDVIHIHV
jgi:hypothetical protein